MVDELGREPFRSDPPNDRPRPTEEAPSSAPRSNAGPGPGPGRGRGPWRAVALALVGLAGATAAVAVLRPPAVAPPPVDAGGEAAIGGPFQLVGVDGRPVDQGVLTGKWSAVFFGYTFCPDTCPATLQALNAAAASLGNRRRDFQVVFISVDPARDTPAQMKLYVSSQGYPPAGLVGLTGSPEQVQHVAAAYHAFYSKTGNGPDYAVQHTAAIYLMDPHGRFAKPLDETVGPQRLGQEIKAAMGA